MAAKRSIEAAQSQIGLAKANAKQDVTFTFDYSHVNASNNGSFFFSIPLPIFNRNQGEVARTYYALTQVQFLEKAAEQGVITDVRNAYEALLNGEEVVQLYQKGYLEQAQQSLDITQFSYQHGAASLLDFLDAERSYRSTELSYRQALATYMSALEQLRQAVGTRDSAINPALRFSCILKVSHAREPFTQNKAVRAFNDVRSHSLNRSAGRCLGPDPTASASRSSCGSVAKPARNSTCAEHVRLRRKFRAQASASRTSSREVQPRNHRSSPSRRPASPRRRPRSSSARWT